MILHLDMDYFFAQVEERENPRFKGKPLIVGADPKGGKARGVVSTCNYEAREFGIHSGMAISRAYEACPQATYLPVNKKLYSRVSERVFSIMEGVTSNCERVSFDEAYLNLSGVVKGYGQAKKIAAELKKLILSKEELTCSIGVGENKMIAKMASEEEKPDGLTVIRPNETKRFISGKPVEEIPGIGPKTKLKIETLLGKSDPKIKDLRGLSKTQLKDELGKRGESIFERARGRDSSKVSSKVKTKSLGRETTFNKNTTDPEKIISTFKSVCKEVAELAKEEEELIKTVVAVCRFEGFNTYTRQKSFNPVEPAEDLIYKQGVRLLLKLLAEKAKPVRLLGVRVIFYKEE